MTISFILSTLTCDSEVVLKPDASHSQGQRLKCTCYKYHYQVCLLVWTIKTMIFHGSSQVFVKHTTKKRKSENDHSQVKEINTFSSLKTLQDLDLFNMEQHHFWHQWSFLIILLVRKRTKSWKYLKAMWDLLMEMEQF